MRSRCIHICILLCLYVHNLCGQTPDDNVIVTKCNDSYISEEKDGIPIVSNRKEISYETARMGASLQPRTYYGEFISLDKASAKGEGKAECKSITPENISFDDSKVCPFNLYLDREEKKTEASFKRTFHDLHYFARVYLGEDYFIREEQLTLIIPQSLSRFHLTEKNFSPAIHCERNINSVGDSVFTYVVTNMLTMKNEKQMPATGKVYPHILITGSFKNYHDMYCWSNKLAQVDYSVSEINILLTKTTTGRHTDTEKIRNTYAWVQQNIRYIAFEAGILGHRPDTPTEALRKRYSDCKGMSPLLRILLKVQGFDARLTDIGTIDIPYRMNEVATLASANHIICSFIYQGKTYHLDATNGYVPLKFVSGSIQGREAMIENGEECTVQTVSILGSSASTDSLYHTCTLSGEQTDRVPQDRATRSWSGDMKEFFLTAYHKNDKSDREERLLRILAGNNHNYQVGSVKWIQQEPQQQWAILAETVINNSVAQVAGSEFYIELDLHNDLFDQPIDTLKRIHGYGLPFRCRIVCHTELGIPVGYTLVYCPKGISIHAPQGTLRCSYNNQGEKIIFRKVMEIKEKLIHHNDIVAWNKNLRKWADACSEQIILKKQ